MNQFSFHHNGRPYTADMSQPFDLSIAINFDNSTVSAFGAPAPHATALSVEGFVGDVRRGGSCNCATYQLTPHCNGTHTECVGHITGERMSVNSIAPTSLLLAAVISVTPQRTKTAFADDDLVITREALQIKLAGCEKCHAVIVRTLPNINKLNTNYDAINAAYFSEDALRYLATINVEHLLVDLPSVDRSHDNGLLLAHRAFWGMPKGDKSLSHAIRRHATITELIYVSDEIVDGEYLLNLQVAPFEADAAPSRPVLYPLLNRTK